MLITTLTSVRGLFFCVTIEVLIHSLTYLLTWLFTHTGLVAVWLSGNVLASINVVALRRARLVLGWVTVRGYLSV